MSPIKDLPYLKKRVAVLRVHLQLLWKEKDAVSWQCLERPTSRFSQSMLLLTRWNGMWPCQICRLGLSFVCPWGLGSIQGVTRRANRTNSTLFSVGYFDVHFYWDSSDKGTDPRGRESSVRAWTQQKALSLGYHFSAGVWDEWCLDFL